MPTNSDENERGLADAVSRVRDFVLQQLQAGQRADSLSLALGFIATEMGLHVTQGRNPLGVMRTALQAVVAATDAFTAEGKHDAPSESGAELFLGTEAVPEGTVLH